MTTSRKKRKVQEASCPPGDVSPPANPERGWTPWLGPSTGPDHEDAPTVKLDAENKESDENNFQFSSFAQLGSVLGKLQSFNKGSTLSTTSSETRQLAPMSAIVPLSVTPQTELQIADTGFSDMGQLDSLVGVAKKVIIETNVLKLFDRNNRLYDDVFGRFGVSKCTDVQLMSFVTCFFESNRAGWGVMEIPGPFGSVGYVVAQKSADGLLSVDVTGIVLKNDKSLVVELEKYGVENIHIINSAPKAVKNTEDEDEEEHTVDKDHRERFRMETRVDVFGFFDFLKSSEIVYNAWKPPCLMSSLAFKDAVYIEPKVVVKKSAKDINHRVVQIDNVFVPLSAVDVFERSSCSIGSNEFIKCHVRNKLT